jgi:hypothetical protein
MFSSPALDPRDYLNSWMPALLRAQGKNEAIRSGAVKR